MTIQCDPRALLALLQGDMSPEETRQLVGHIEDCGDCQERLQVMAGLAALKQGAVRRRWASYGKFGLLAAGLLIALLLPVLWNEGPESSWAEVATDSPHPVFPLQTRAEHTPPELREALALYSNGAYGEAEKLFAGVGDNTEALFFRGVCLYLLGRFEEALHALEAAREDGGPWEEPASWYRANALLRLGQLARAREALQELARASGSFSDKAKAVLKQINDAE